MNELLYSAYRFDRDSGMSHAQIVSDGVYGSLVEDFCLRFDLAQSRYADAMKTRAPLIRHREMSADGRFFRGGE